MTNTNREKLRAHWQEWRGFYIGVAVGVVLAGITLLVVRGALRSHDLRALRLGSNETTMRKSLSAAPRLGADCPIQESTGSFSSAGDMYINSHVVQTTHTGRVGHPGFITRCVETGELFLSQGDAARAHGVAESALSAHLNRGLPLDQGVNFERLGVIG